MSRYFTSDLHLGSSNINQYAHRPFRSAQEAVDTLIKNINDKLELTDSLIHVGDFLLAGHDRHDVVEDVGLDYSMNDYMSKLYCRLFLLAGNHDDSHNGEADAKSLVLDLNKNYRNVYVSHYPSTHQFYRGPDRSSRKTGVGIVLCGHVHDKWILYYDWKKNILNVNVSVDVWDYKPVRDSQITEMLDFLFMHGKNLFNMTQPGFVAWNRNRWNKWVLKINGELAAAREQRRKEKLERKGLTPEECERRRIEAMKAKGLIK